MIRATQTAKSFSEWQATHFSQGQISNPNVGGLAGIAYGDGISNGLRYFFNLNPDGAMTSADIAALPHHGMKSDGPRQYLTLTDRQNAAITGITMEVQTGSDLTVNP